MLLSKNKKNNVYPCKPQFYFIKVGFKGVKNICFRDAPVILPKAAAMLTRGILVILGS